LRGLLPPAAGPGGVEAGADMATIIVHTEDLSNSIIKTVQEIFTNRKINGQANRKIPNVITKYSRFSTRKRI
jgi:hypothetical protein